MFKIFKTKQTLELEAGGKLEKLEIAYHSYGDKSKPVVWVCQALTGNSDVFDWWNGLFGKGYYFNQDEYFIICANFLNSYMFVQTGIVVSRSINLKVMFVYLETLLVEGSLASRDMIFPVSLKSPPATVAVWPMVPPLT